MDTNEQRQESQQNRREERHKRRQRSQIIAYTVVGIMILVLAAGIAFAVSKITGMNHDRQEQQNKLDHSFRGDHHGAYGTGGDCTGTDK